MGVRQGGRVSGGARAALHEFGDWGGAEATRGTGKQNAMKAEKMVSVLWGGLLGQRWLLQRGTCRACARGAAGLSNSAAARRCALS